VDTPQAAGDDGDTPSPLLLVIDRGGRVRIAEGDALASLGLAADALEGRAAADALRHWPELHGGIEAALAGRPNSARMRPDGHSLELQFTPRRDARGAPTGVIVSSLERSRLEAPEQTMRDRERNMQLVFRQVPGAIWATDRQLRITYALGNPPPQAGFDVENIVGTTVYDIVGTEDPSDPVIANHLAALAGRSARFQLEYRGLWVEILIRPLRDATGAVVGCVAAGTDQTERCRTRRELERSKSQLADAQQIARIGSFDWDVESDRMSWSEGVASVLGLEPEALDDSLDSLFSHVHPDDVGELEKQVFEAVRSARSFETDIRLMWKDGSERIFHARSRVVTDGQGKVVRLIGCFQDVTESRLTTRALEESVSLLRATLEATADGILVANLEGRVVVYNQRFLDLWNIPAVLAARGDEDLLLARVREDLDDPEKFMLDVRDRYAQVDSESCDTLNFRDGRVYERHSRPQWIGDVIEGRVWSFRDVTEHKRLLRRSELLADAARMLGSLGIERALEGVARLAVPRLADACAIDLFEEGGPRRLIEVCQDEDRCFFRQPHPAVLDRHASLYRAGGAQYLGIPLASRRGLVGIITLLAPPDGHYSEDDVELAEELGRRVTLAIENARAYQEVQEAIHARDEFLAIAAHELRGPLSAMRLAVQGLIERTVPKQRKPALLEIIGRENRRLERLADELLDVGRIRAGNLRFELENVDLGDVIHEVAGRLRNDIAQSGSALSVSIQGDLVGSWDRFRLEQVVNNLLGNAVKFGRGEPIEIRARGEADRVVLSVRDHGIGIPPALRDQIFSPFDRAVSSRHYGGLGLGLYIVRRVVEGFGGSARAEDPDGPGALFIIELPKARD
jgi:signal transduction histidine kinase/PAS domain-containing protein